MDRYQFEGYISDYIENALSIAKRREFEQFLADNPEAKEEVNAVRVTMLQLKTLPAVKTSDKFLTNLQQRIGKQSVAIPVPIDNRRPMIFGFTPLTAGMMSLVILAIVFVGYELMPSGSSNPIAIPPQITTNNVMSAPMSQPSISPTITESTLAAMEEDSSIIEKDLRQISPELEEKINYVKTQ